MRIETIDIHKLLPAEYNARLDLQQEDEEYQRIKRSIETFGLVDPVIWNERTGHVVGGHQRLKVLTELGYTELQVSVVDLSLEEEKALNGALNKIGGDWDLPKLKDLLGDLQGNGFDAELTGFSFDEIEDMLEEINLDELDEEQEEDKDLSGKLKDTYEVIIECQSEEEQEELFNRLEGEGHKCRVLTL